MPQAIPLVFKAGLTYLGASATTISIVTAVSTAAVGLYERDRALKARHPHESDGGEVAEGEQAAVIGSRR
jgi:hypothetical protein